MKSDPNRYPAGWTPKKVRSVAAHYERQSDADAIVEAEAAYRKRTTALVEVPIKLLPAILRLLAAGTAV